MKLFRILACAFNGIPVCPVCHEEMYFKHGAWNCREFCDPYEPRVEKEGTK